MCRYISLVKRSPEPTFAIVLNNTQGISQDELKTLTDINLYL